MHGVFGTLPMPSLILVVHGKMLRYKLRRVLTKSMAAETQGSIHQILLHQGVQRVSPIYPQFAFTRPAFQPLTFV